MTDKLGINLIAEVVETERQFSHLKHQECSSYQGYLFGKPMPPHEVEKNICLICEAGLIKQQLRSFSRFCNKQTLH